KEIEIIAVNDIAEPAALAHLLKYDSVHRHFGTAITVEGSDIIVNGKRTRILSEKNPADLPWKEMEIDLVIESTGKFTSKDKASLHLQAGAEQLLVSAPSPDKDIPAVVLGVNDQEVDFSSPLISNASCTTNNVAPMVKVLDDNWGIIDGYITTVHSMTGDQNLHDAPHKDLRRARAASASIIPTTTGAAKAITSI